VRILIAGLGAIGQRHARNLRALQGGSLELLAYRSRRLRYVVTETLSRDDTRDVESELGVHAFDDLDAALAERPDAVFVCTPTSRHLDIAQRAADAGCHLFVEKPLSHSIDGVERLLATVAAKRLVGVVGCQWRFHPCVRALKDLIASGTLGATRQAEIEYAEYLPDWHPYEDYRRSYAARADLGGGVVLTQIHDYDLAFWLFGMPHAVRASGGRLSDLEIDVEDTADAILETPAGTVQVRQSFARRPPRRTILVRGERCTASLDLLASSLTLEPPLAPAVSLPEYQRNQMFLDEAAHFLDCIEGRASPATPLTEGALVLRIALAVKDALRSGRRVDLA
jgi:predicted dehydrogenase